MKFPKIDKDIWIIIIILLVLGISTISKSTNKKRSVDDRVVIIDTVLVKQVCVGKDEQECITLMEPQLMNIVKKKDDRDPSKPYIISLEPKN